MVHILLLHALASPWQVDSNVMTIMALPHRETSSAKLRGQANNVPYILKLTICLPAITRQQSCYKHWQLVQYSQSGSELQYILAKQAMW